MQKNKLVYLLIMLAGVAVVGGYYLMNRPAPMEPAEIETASDETPEVASEVAASEEATQEEAAPEETAPEEIAEADSDDATDEEPEDTAPDATADAGTEDATEPEEGPIAGDAAGPFLSITVAGEVAGTITIDLFEQVAPNHVARITALADGGEYDGVVFHRVIAGFMAQTGDVEFGRSGGDMARVGQGGSEQPDLGAEFSDVPFERGMVGMARSQSPDSANSQFFIMFAPATHLNGQYTIVGMVTDGLDILDKIKLGDGPNGAVIGAPDVMQTVTVTQ